MGIEVIQVEQVGSQYKFRPMIMSLPGFPNFHQVEAIGIVRDADSSYENVFSSVQDALRMADLPVPNQPLHFAGNDLKIIVFIAPDNNSIGALEDICLASVQDDPIMKCVDDYMRCLKDIQNKDHDHANKARTQVYLAKEPEGNIHMGIAAKKDIWNWQSTAFGEVRDFILQLAQI
ncbi:hypothetical protein FJZ33_07010 [Candidatus Poribacteria bacterium]|nr:hypothetical protein [Candidatus Poribacteria bacterium]